MYLLNVKYLMYYIIIQSGPDVNETEGSIIITF